MRSWKTLLAAAALSYASHALALGGLADLSVYDRTEGRQLAVHWHEGRAYVAGEPGNEYQVTLRSRSREEVLAVVSVDGINVITGQSADPAQSGYVLAPRVRAGDPRLAQEPRPDGGLLLHLAARFLCRAHRATG
jgi:hypothetical protein